MIISAKHWSLKCDCCNTEMKIFCDNVPDALDTAENEGWWVRLRGGRDYCPECYTVRDGVIYAKDGKTFNPITGRRLAHLSKKF